MNPETPNKTDAGNGSYGICRVSNVSRSPSPDPSRSPRMKTFASITGVETKTTNKERKEET
jgi:hypothetical protein